jgi:hypothetical protein
MNWELQLAAAMEYEDETLVSEARRARELCSRYQFGKAMAILWDGLVDARRSGPPKRLVFLLLHIGKVYENWMYDVAFKFFREALETSRDDDFPAGEMVALEAIARLYLTWREPERALPRLERCLALARRCAGPSCQRDVLRELMSCHAACGNRGRWRELAGELSLLDEIVNACGEPPGRRER